MSSSAPPLRKGRRGTGAVTLRQVAEIAGVAPITASRVINTPEQVSPEVRERVLQAVRQTGYVPNLLAGGLASAKSRMVAAVVPNLAVSVFLDTVQTLNDALFARGYQLMLGQTGYATEREDALLEAIIGRRPDGIVVTGVVHAPEARQRLLASGIPVVETWDLSDDPIDMAVGFSHAAIGQQVCDYLRTRGRQRLGLITAHDERALRRARSFAAQAQAAGLPPVAVVDVGDSRTLHSGRTGLARLLVDHPDLDAVFCSSDLLAMGAVTEAQCQGRRVPDDVAVVGFGDFAFVADTVPSITSVHINGSRIGQLAADYLMARAEGRPTGERVVDVGFSITERDSA